MMKRMGMPPEVGGCHYQVECKQKKIKDINYQIKIILYNIKYKYKFKQ